MLKYLDINNYALIDRLRFEPGKAMTAITGETGAGKSIIMGALGLVLGKRADSRSLRDESRKCVIEAGFNIAGFDLRGMFDEAELDYDDETIIRREISPSGKSRSFINDSPVTLPVLKLFADRLIDIHSQHENLLLRDYDFLMDFVDLCSQTPDLKKTYQEAFLAQEQWHKKWEDKRKELNQKQKDADYIQFQLEQLRELNLCDDMEQEELEKELQVLEHAEEIKLALHTSTVFLQGEEGEGVDDQVSRALGQLQKIKSYNASYAELLDRLKSVEIELRDIVGELEMQNMDCVYDPERLGFVTERLNMIYTQEKKHGVDSVKALREIEADLSTQMSELQDSDDVLMELEKQYQEKLQYAQELASTLSKNRKNKMPFVEEELTLLLQSLGIASASVKFEFSQHEALTNHGWDHVELLFSGNKGSKLKPVVEVASGGEIARLMLSIKSILGVKKQLPSIIFDEIDTGVSGEIAHKMGEIIRSMGENMQVVCITHLAQIAAKAECHFKVFKVEGETTETHMELLDLEKRVKEIAGILSGAAPSEAALENAKELLGCS